MHPLWNLFPAAICAAIFVAASYCLIEETRDGIPKPNWRLLATITATGTTSAIAAPEYSGRDPAGFLSGGYFASSTGAGNTGCSGHN